MNKQFRHAIIFMAGTMLLTWIFYFSIILLKLSPYKGPGLILLLLGGSAPSYLGVIFMFFTYDKSQKLEYVKRFYVIRRITPFSWAVILMLAPAILTISICLNNILGGTVPGMTMLKDIIASPILIFPCILLSFMSGPFSEELGWRGFALDPLLARFGLIKGSVFLGFVWGIWHLPLYFMPETWHGKMGFQLAGFWSFILYSIGLSIIISMIYINSSRSILSAMLMHLSFNFSAQLISGPVSPGYEPRIELIRTVIVIITAAGMCVYMSRTEKSAQSS